MKKSNVDHRLARKLAEDIFDQSSTFVRSLDSLKQINIGLSQQTDIMKALSVRNQSLMGTSESLGKLSRSTSVEMAKAMSSALEPLHGAHRVADLAAAFDPLGETTKVTKRLAESINGFADVHTESLASLNAALDRGALSVANAHSIGESITKVLGQQQEALSDALAGISASQAIDIARVFNAASAPEWEEVESFETLSDEDAGQLRIKILAVMMTILRKADPRTLTRSDYLTIFLFVLAITNPDFTEEDRAMLQESNELASLAADYSEEAMIGVNQLLEAERAADALMSYVSELPRAQVRSKGYIREHPIGSSTRATVLEMGAPLAVAAKKGRWLQVVYREPLTQELEVGWIWSESVETL